MRTLRRHLLPICSTAAFILIAWMIITLPVVAVFLFDKQFAISDYLKFLLYAGGAGTGVSAGILFPLALLFEQLAKRTRPLAAVVPVVMLVISMVCLLGRFLLTEQFLETVFGWPGLMFVFSLVFSFYWTVLWIGKGLIYGARRFAEKASA